MPDHDGTQRSAAGDGTKAPTVEAAALPEAPEGSEELEARIAREATRLFADKGYAGVSVREICEAAGTTKPMLYYYFGSKEGLFARLIASPFERFNAILREGAERDGPVEGFLTTYAVEHLRWVTEDGDHARLVFATSLGPQRGAPSIDFARFKAHNSGLLEEIFGRAQTRGELVRRPTEDLVQAFLGAVLMACMQHLLEGVPAPRDLEARAREVTHLFLAGAGAGSLAAGARDVPGSEADR